MWIFLSNAFLSIVADRNNDGNLLVRARFADDIARVFPKAEINVTPAADYRFRTSVPRATVAEAVAQALMTMTATNFKNSVAENWRHDVYFQVWNLLFDAQARRAGTEQRPRR